MPLRGELSELIAQQLWFSRSPEQKKCGGLARRRTATGD
jgi:hypothetical protein